MLLPISEGGEATSTRESQFSTDAAAGSDKIERAILERLYV